MMLPWRWPGRNPMVSASSSLAVARKVLMLATAFIFGFAARQLTSMNRMMFLLFFLPALIAINITKSPANFWSATLLGEAIKLAIFIGSILSVFPARSVAAWTFLLNAPTPTPVLFFLIATAALFLTTPAPFGWKWYHRPVSPKILI